MFEAIRSGRLMPRGLLLTLFAAALLLRAMVPAGWMPSSEGGFRFDLCTGTGLAKAPPEALKAMAKLVDHQTSKDGEQPTGPEPPCTFASLGFDFPSPETAPSQLATILPDAPIPLRPLAPAPGRGLAAPPPPATGPPAFS